MWQASTYGWLLVYAAASSSKLSQWCAVHSESCCMQTAFLLLYMLGKHAWKLLHASCYVLYTVHAAKYKLLYASCCMQAAADKLLHASCWMLPKVGRRPCVVSPSDGFTRIQPSQPTNSPQLLTTPMYMYTITTTILRTLQITLTTTWLFIQCSNYLIKKKICFFEVL